MALRNTGGRAAARFDGHHHRGLDPRLCQRAGDRGRQATTGIGLVVNLESTSARNWHPIIRLNEPGKTVDVWLRARFSVHDVIARGVKDVEIRRVKRRQETTGVAGDRGRLPAGISLGGVDDVPISGATYSFSKQAGEQVSTTSGVRHETTEMTKGTGAVVTARVDIDVYFDVWEKGRDGIGTPTRIHLPGAADGVADVVMFDHDLNMMLTGRDAPSPAQPFEPVLPTPWRSIAHDELREAAIRRRTSRQETLIKAMAEVLRKWSVGDLVSITKTAEPTIHPEFMTEALLIARELGADVHLMLTEPGGVRHALVATPTGELYGDDFARTFATLPPELVTAAMASGIDLREMFDENPEDLARRLEQRLGAHLPEERVVRWPVPETAADARRAGNVVGQGNVV
jgi:hypothetical protein